MKVSFLEKEKGYSTNTIRSYRRDLEDFNEFITEYYPHLTIEEIGYPQGRYYLSFLQKKLFLKPDEKMIFSRKRSD